LRIFEQLVEIGVALLDAKGVADRVEVLLGALADGAEVGLGMTLINGDELRAKTQTDDGEVDLALAHGWQTCPRRARKAFVALRKTGTAMRDMSPIRRRTVNGNFPGRHASGFFQIGTTRFISSMRYWQAAKASPRCGATSSTQSDGSFTPTTPRR